MFAAQADCVFWGSRLSGLCLATVALQQTLVAVGVGPVQGRMRKGRGGAGCTVGKEGGAGVDEINR